MPSTMLTRCTRTTVRRSRRKILRVEAMERLLVLSPTLPLPPPHVPMQAALFEPPNPCSKLAASDTPPDPCAGLASKYVPPDPC
jgi:hypothetical protein